MAVTKSDYFRERAAESAQQAEDSKLDNVRERNLRSEAAWLSMADAAASAEADRARIAAEKADPDETE